MQKNTIVMKTYKIGNFNILEYEEIASTNTCAAEKPSSELTDRMVILTWRQTQGRGQVGNSWESAPERNISMTVVLKPEHLEASRQFAVSMIIALGCFDFVSRYTDNVSVKWPNDIYVGDKKIAGILIEHKITGMYIGNSICGVGININQEQFISNAPNPISLLQLIGHPLPLQQVLEELLACIDARYADIHNYANLEKDFLHHLYRGTGIHQWEDIHGRFHASIAGMDEYGQLRLLDEEGHERLYAFKEVTYL